MRKFTFHPFLALVAGLVLFSGCATRRNFAFEHVAIDVADPVATADWWVRNLDFRLVRTSPDPFGPRFIVDRTGRVAMELYRSSTGATLPDYPAMDTDTLHFGLVSDDPEADAARLVAAGARVVRRQRFPGLESVIVKDPTGLSIQFARREQPVIAR